MREISANFMCNTIVLWLLTVPNDNFSTFRLKLNREFLNVENIKLFWDEISSIIDVNVICFRISLSVILSFRS